ncbi:uncharacterized protein LOC129963945 [Argiope bruennichi]|uniref:uncharacterized protein LOC129963945 n=1 Tax=Argiope bruennichi TaxID=94029 RepID=UPI0024944C75|nr:uncharacterized protein LOC129963945 [Argiope bruennichi]
MASSKSRAWGPTHPSAAFLIKCAKEREKLRSTLQAQLREHMLCMLQNNIFSDTLIGVNSKEKENNSEIKTFVQQQSDLPQLFPAHKALLKVRTPSFFNHLNEHQESNLGVESYNSYLQDSELLHFLKNVYTDDDIRKHECEALHLSKKYIELLHHNKAPVNKHILEVDEFEKESVHSSCTDNFVTPKTSPVSPEAKANVLELFGAAQNQTNIMKTSNANVMVRNNSNTYKVKSHVNGELHIDTNIEREFSSPDQLEAGVLYESKRNNGKQSRQSPKSINTEKSGSDHDTDDSDDDSEPGDFSNVGSMVRSNTFDLETQGSLEEAAIDDSIEWCYRESPANDSKDLENQQESHKDSYPSKRNESTGFFLHDHSPSPRSNLFRSPFAKEPSFNSSQELESASPGYHFRRLDGSMSDSGFMSHSTFSLISDAGYSNSIASSLIMSSEATSSSPVTIGSEVNGSLSEKSRKLSGSMFPFYIDINSLPPPSPDTAKGRKSSPSHTYMYIDARTQNTDTNSQNRKSNLNTSYKEFFSGMEAHNAYPKKEPLMKAQSTSHLDAYKGEVKTYDLTDFREKLRPQSCYMYVDLDSVPKETKESNYHSRFNSSTVKEPSSVAMFINLNDETIQENNCSRIKNEDLLRSTEKTATEELGKDFSIKDYKITNSAWTGKQRRKLSDSSLSLNQMENKPNFFSLTKHRESRSATSLDRQQVNGYDGVPQLKNSRKSRSAHRYSDGIYYDNLYQQKILNTNYNSLDKKFFKDPKTYAAKDLKAFDQTFRLIQNISKNEESSGSCSNLGKATFAEKLLIEDKVKWKSTGDMEKPNGIPGSEDAGLLPMSPILRRKAKTKDVQEPSKPPIVVKASTKPQDVDAMKFPPTLLDESLKLSDKAVKDDAKMDVAPSPTPSNKRTDKGEDSKSSSESLKLGSDPLSESSDTKMKNTNSMSRSGSSHVSGGEGETGLDKLVVKEKTTYSPLSISISCDLEDDSETIYSEVSDVSSSAGALSGIASLERRWRESQNQQLDFSSQNLRKMYHMLEACSKLGEDLLRMFLDEIDTDIVIEVDGKQIKAHRCILASRCKYFASLLRVNNCEKNASTISLEGFSYPAVHFALCHIYSGAMNIPKDCNISELTLLADMLNLETLTDVIVFHLKMHYCHFFHRPCLQCSQGVVECLPLAAVCGLNELRDKCIYWLGKNFTRTWTNKSFAALSEELRDLCYNVTVHNLSIDTVIDMTLNCDRLLTTLPQLKWTEPIFGMITRLLQDCIHFMAKNFNQILKSEGFLALGKGQSWNVTALEEDIISSIELMTPDVACKSYESVNQLIRLAESIENTEYGEFTQNFLDLLHKISRHSERYLIQNANKVVHCQSWACLSPQVQKRIKDAAVIVFEFEKPTAPPPRLSSLQRKLKKQNEGEDFGCLERSTYPKKSRGTQNKKYQRDCSPKSINSQCNQESPERNLQRRESDNLIKKIVSPIKEEAHYSSVENSVQDTSCDLLSGGLNPYYSPARSHFSNKAYVDTHEEDSLRDLQDLPQDHTNHGEPGSESQMMCSIASLDMDDSRSPAHCSDNPDSLEANEISSDSKDDADLSVSAEDGSNPEKGVNEKPEVLHKNFEAPSSEEKEICTKLSPSDTSLPKPSLLIPVRDKNSSHQVPSPIEKEAQNGIHRDKSPIKKSHGKSHLPLAKMHILEENKSSVVESKGKDLVAEIDADSRMVSHCLQEAEMLEQQLSRKLQRQHQKGSSNLSHYMQNSPSRTRVPSDHHGSSKSYGSRLQKASSTSQIKNLVTTPSRGRSPGRGTKSSASSPSVGHPPKIIRCNEPAKEKMAARKSSHSPKGAVSSSIGPFRSTESIANVHKQLSGSGVLATPKRASSRSNRSKVITVSSVRTSAVGPK